MTKDELLTAALGEQRTSDPFVAETIVPQLGAIFDCFLASNDVDGAMSMATKIKQVREYTANGQYAQAIDIMVSEGMPRGYAQAVLAMISGTENAETSVGSPA